ncbi:DNA sulfur modification protein DndD [Silvimonas iriomotensis]|uniref:Rad50/SbcC-type AAA domain-containing protein n=1 Tax=Silvimonas iriomotensis TaxID=449662 RepID=A0ABQ2PF45_9NEIS|nr:DNA sulfur modification protein DndD [Silvimonas iriomotensis]GGP23790.1 hypothetical protein GCM10010970_37900 [Silvimonas iriomotensis]
MAKLTITQIAIENLGPFRERQTIDLDVKGDRPVILIKALNGSGKTTLLTALQIGLYGYKAINPARRSEYDQLIAGLQRKDAVSNAVVDLTLSIEIGAYKQTLLVHREWEPHKSSPKEQFAVFSNGMRDLEYTEMWDEFINSILPVELVQLFLFDGEKIESLANPERLPHLLRRATEVFLGLGGIDTLANDLKALERRAASKKDTANSLDKARADADDFDRQLKEVNDRIDILIQRQGQAHSELDAAQRRLEAFSVAAQRNGLTAYQQAAQLNEQAKIAKQQHEIAHNGLVHALEDPFLPLQWIKPLWERYRAQMQQEKQARHANLLAGEFAKRDERILQLLAIQTPQAKDTVASLLRQDLKRFAVPQGPEPILLLGADPLEIEPRLEQAAHQLKKATAEVENAAKMLEQTQLSAAQIPAKEQLSDIFDGMQHHTKAVADAERELQGLTTELSEARAMQTHLENRWNASLQRMRAELKDNALELKALDASARAKKALAIFRERLLASKAQWLADMITTEFKRLLRKRNLVSKVVVDPTSYAVAIEDVRGHVLPMERLSAGERQILAIAVLSALISERKGRFPVVVDTPLARLDRKHREALINNFFAKISHQVLVLSTDEEVEGSVYQTLQRHLNREYELIFDDASRSSSAALHQPQILAEAIS